MSNKYHQRYTITAIKKDGRRQLAFDNNHYNTYLTMEEADQYLATVIQSNSPDRIADLIGKDLDVRLVMCYPGGDATQTYFD